MRSPPRKHAETGLFKELWRAFNDLRDYCQEISPLHGKGIRMTRTSNGTVFAVQDEAAVESTPFQWQGEWDVASTYAEGDIVIRGSNNLSSASRNNSASIIAAGKKAGVFIALKAVPAGTEPTEPNTGIYWETLARFATNIFVVADVTNTTGASKFIIDSRSANGQVNARLQDCNGKTLYIREVEVCLNNVTKHMMVLASDPY
jgi:hypothetical protein